MQVACGHRRELARRRIRLPSAVVAPAGHGGVAAHPARMRLACGHGGERTRRRIRLPMPVELAAVAPAGHGAVSAHPARMRVACGHRGERTRRRIRLPVVVPAPAGHGAVSAHPARMRVACGHCGERTRRRIRLLRAVEAPAGHGAVSAHPARMRAHTFGHRGERTRRRIRLPFVEIAGTAPAGHRAVRAQPARMDPADGHCGERTRRRIRLPAAVQAPAGHCGIAAQPARMPGTSGYRGESAGVRLSALGGFVVGVGACGCVSAGAPPDKLRGGPAGSATETCHVATGELRIGHRGGAAHDVPARLGSFEACPLGGCHVAVSGTGEDHAIGVEHPGEGDSAVDVRLRLAVSADDDGHVTGTIGFGPRLGAVEIRARCLRRSGRGQDQRGCQKDGNHGCEQTSASSWHRQTAP